VVTVPGLAALDIVRVYQNTTAAVPLAAIVNPSNGKVYVNQLGVGAGTVYVTVQSTGKIESGRGAGAL
jgi:hypothetical protein